MATKQIAKKAAPKKAAKKAAPKKSAAKKPTVTTKEAPKKKAPTGPVPYRQFEGHEVTVRASQPDVIRFGCGAVTCNRKTLIRVAEFLENKQFAGMIQTAQSLGNFGLDTLMRATPEVRKNVINILTHEGFAVGYQSLVDLYKETNGRKSINELIRLGSTTFRRLAATKRVGC